MQLRLLGALFLASSGVFAGFTCARRAKQALLQCLSLLQALRDMRSRIDMTRDPLPHIARELSHEESAVSPVFASACALMDEGAGFSQAMAQACPQIEDPRAREIASWLFSCAGSCDADETLRRFDSACGALEERSRELEAGYGEKAPLMRRLGAAAGICAAILFI